MNPPTDGSGERPAPGTDDDPTHALDDFVRRLRPAGAPPPGAADPTDLSDLVARLQPARPAAPAKPRGGTLRNGQTWSAEDVEDVPVVELRTPRDPAPVEPPQVQLPPVAPPAAPDTAALDEATRRARDFASSQWDTDGAADAAADWQPDPQALRLRPATDPRLLARWQPGAWIGAVREVFTSTTEFVQGAGGPTVETWPPHRLLLLWPPPRPDAPLPGRWPQVVRLSALPQAQAAEALLADLPDDARLWLLPEADTVDWALAAEIALLHEPALRPFQLEGLRAFIEAEREAGFAALNRGYVRDAARGAITRR